MGTVTVSGTCIEKFGEKKQRKVEKILRHPIREKKSWFPSRGGNQEEFDSHGQKYFPVRANSSFLSL